MSITTQRKRRTVEVQAVLICDQCGAEYEPQTIDGRRVAIADGWIALTEHGPASAGEQHVCGWACLQKYAKGRA